MTLSKRIRRMELRIFGDTDGMLTWEEYQHFYWGLRPAEAKKALAEDADLETRRIPNSPRPRKIERLLRNIVKP